MGHYYENFEDLESRIFGDSSMMSPSDSSCSSEACRTDDSFADIQHIMMSLGCHSQLCPSRSVEEVVHPTLPYISKPLMIHLNKTEEDRWTGMTFIPQSHNIYCIYFHLRHEGMYYLVENFKSSSIIGVANMIVKKIGDIPVCTKKSVSKCRDSLRLLYEYLQCPTP